MLKYKALCKKMMDDLKDAEMWLDWAGKLKEEEPELAKYLYLSAKNRVMSNFPEAKSLFDQLCAKEAKKDHSVFKELLDDHLDEWKSHVEDELKKWK